MFCRLEGQECIDDLGMGLRVRPKFGDLGPLGTQAILVDVAILDDKSVKRFRVSQDHAETNWRAVVVEIERVVVDIQRGQKIANRLGKMIERVSVG